MRGCSAAAGRMALLCAVLALAAPLAGCDDAVETPPATVTASSATATVVSPPAPGPAARPAAAAEPQAQLADAGDAAQISATLQNDPSAPTNTPLCGFAAQETNALSRQLLPRQYAEAGQCSAYACYDAATATYIGADGYRHVCR